MKKLIVGENCAACGYCVAESNFFEEQPDGKATPKNMGLITDEQCADVLRIVSECSAKAIKIVDDETTKAGGSVGIAELQKLIDDKLRGFQIKEPHPDDFRYPKETYRTTVAVSKLTSEYKYSDSAFTSADEIAEREGASEFARSIYPLKEVMVKELLVFYKIDKLNKFAYLEYEDDNYYSMQNKRVRDILKEIEIKALELTNGQIVLPSNFTSFNIGPDNGYDGNTYCYNLRNAENMAHLANEFPPADYYSHNVKSFSNGDRWCYDLRDVFEEFRKAVDFELWHRLPDVYDWIYEALDPYKKTLKKEILKKVATVKNALKQCGFVDTSDNTAVLKQDLKEIIDNLKKAELNKEYVDAWGIDYDWDSDYRFTSMSECREAMNNRVDRLYSECSHFINDDLCRELGKRYSEQIEKFFSQARIDIQRVYDKYGQKYPPMSVKIKWGNTEKQSKSLYGGFIFNNTSSNDKVQSFSLSSFEEIRLNIGGEIESFIKEKIIGSKVNIYEYLERADCRIDDCEDTKIGWFGREVSCTKYGYWMESHDAIDKLNKGCDRICKATFEDGFINKIFCQMVGVVITQLEKLIQ